MADDSPARELSGRVALVTGSTSGIGLGIARQLATMGADVMLNGSRAEPPAEALALGEDHGVRVAYRQADLSKADECTGLVEATVAEMGRIDILVNNAGIQHVAPIEDFGADNWDRIIAINLSSCFHTMAAAVPLMKAQEWGRIINISSVHGLVASVGKAGYCAAKHGMNGITKVVALETAQENITANAVCPGWVLTPLVEAQIQKRVTDDVTYEQAKTALLCEKQPSGNFSTVDDVGKFCAFLCSSGAGQITGACLTMDGGWTTQ